MIQEGQVRLQFLGQSGFVLTFPTGRILVDGYFSAHPDRLAEPPVDASELTDLDIIAFTHEHGDHLDIDAVPLLAAASPTARFVAPTPCVRILAQCGVSAERIVSVEPDQSVMLAGIEIRPVRARHALKGGEPYSFGENARAFRFLGYVLRAQGVVIYHAGDTIDYEGLAETLRSLAVDVALLPINGRDADREKQGIAGNLDAREAAVLAIAAGVDVAIPMHHDMFATNPGYPEDFVRAFRELHAPVTAVVMSTGSSFTYTKGS